MQDKDFTHVGKPGQLIQVIMHAGYLPEQVLFLRGDPGLHYMIQALVSDKDRHGYAIARGKPVYDCIFDPRIADFHDFMSLYEFFRSCHFKRFAEE